MAIVCPTVMPRSGDAHEFRAQMDRVGGLSNRLQIDLMDGVFAPNHNTTPGDIWWPEGVKADIHLMYRHPDVVLDELVALRPHMIILHAESKGDVTQMLGRIQTAGVLAGVALLKGTQVADVTPMIEQADHVLLFGGELGESGWADLSIMEKIGQVRAIKPLVEIGWDGGVDDSNIALLAEAGVDVLNTGGALRRAESPVAEFGRLQQLIR